MHTDISILESLLIAVVAMSIVFVVLIIIIFITTGIQKGMEVVDSKTKILPNKENQILDEDSDAVVAVLTATIDFHKETGKDPIVKSVTRIEE